MSMNKIPVGEKNRYCAASVSTILFLIMGTMLFVNCKKTEEKGPASNIVKGFVLLLAVGFDLLQKKGFAKASVRISGKQA